MSVRWKVLCVVSGRWVNKCGRCVCVMGVYSVCERGVGEGVMCNGCNECK